MLSFLLRRIAAVLPVLLVVSLVVFLILRLAPGDPAAAIAGNNATNDDIAKIRTQLGLDSSIPVQYGIWMGRVLQGDLGYSFYLSKPVTELITQRVEPTLALALGTIVLAVLLAVPLGTLAAWRLGGWLDRLLSGFSDWVLADLSVLHSPGMVARAGLQKSDGAGWLGCVGLDAPIDFALAHIGHGLCGLDCPGDACQCV
jgi:ABC-type dipeptide/oligopeptide/nickel transport system permease component